MNQEELTKRIEILSEADEIGTIQLTYNEFREYRNIIINRLNNKGVAMFSDNVAAVCFNGNENIRFVVKNLCGKYKKESFQINGLNLTVIGTDFDKLPSTKRLLSDDISYNKGRIGIIIITSFIIFNFFGTNIESLIKLNDSLLSIIGVFVASFFVFIGLFYNDKKKTIDSFKKGVFDKYHKTDKYILNLSVLAIFLDIVSTGILNFKCTNIKFKQFFLKYMTVEQYHYIKFNIAFICTLLSIIFLVICLDSIVNYYLQRIRNNYFVDAYDDLIRELKENRNR